MVSSPSFPRNASARALDCGTPTDEENNLARLMNAWSPPPWESRVWPPVEKGPPELRIPTLYVGSSFLFNVIRAARALDILQPSVFYFYDEHVIDTSDEHVRGPIQPGSDAWREETFSKSLFVLGVLESHLPDANDRFLDEIEEELLKPN
jgi:hypothetical protein